MLANHNITPDKGIADRDLLTTDPASTRLNRSRIERGKFGVPVSRSFTVAAAL